MSIPKHINGSPFTTLGGIIKLLYCYVSFLKHFDLFVALCSCFSVKIFLTLPIQLNRQRFNPHSWGLFDVTRGGLIVPTVCEFLKVHEELRKVIKFETSRIEIAIWIMCRQNSSLLLTFLGFCLICLIRNKIGGKRTKMGHFWGVVFHKMPLVSPSLDQKEQNCFWHTQFYSSIAPMRTWGS